MASTSQVRQTAFGSDMKLAPEEAAPIHRRMFAEFCSQEMMAGGPDPQVKLTAEAIKRHPIGGPELAGLFVVPYSCAGAAVLWRLWERKPDPLTWEGWLHQHGGGIPVRKERRPVKGHWGRFSISAATYIQWSQTEYHNVKDSSSYEEVFKSLTKHVKYVGRYAAMKLLETLYQADLIAAQQNTMVPRDAKYPRRTIALLMPEHTEMLKENRDEAEVDALCERIRQGIIARIGQDVTWFQIETMLCIYRQSLKGKYPMGRQDSELGHWTRSMEFYGEEAAVQLNQQFPFSQLRRELYPIEYLGEWNDPPWYGIRPALEEQRKAEMDAMGIA